MILLRTWPREFWEQNLPSRSSWSNVVTQPQYYAIIAGDFPGGPNAKELACQCRRYKRCVLNPWVRKIPWGREWKPTPVFLSGESHGWRSLAGYSPQHCRVRCNWSDLACTHVSTAIVEVPLLRFLLIQSLSSQIDRPPGKCRVFFNSSSSHHLLTSSSAYMRSSVG